MGFVQKTFNIGGSDNQYKLFILKPSNDSKRLDAVFVDEQSPRSIFIICKDELSSLIYRRDLYNLIQNKKNRKNQYVCKQHSQECFVKYNIDYGQDCKSGLFIIPDRDDNNNIICVQVNQGMIYQYNNKYNFANLGDFSLEKIVGQPEYYDEVINNFIIQKLPSINIGENKTLSLVHGIKLLSDDWKLGFIRTFFQSIDYEGNFELKSGYSINNSTKLYYQMPNSKDKETLEIIKTIIMEKPTLLKRMKKFPDKFYQEIKFKVRKEPLKDKKSKKKAAKDEKATEGQNKKGKKWSFSNLFKRKPRENRDNDDATLENGYNDIPPPDDNGYNDVPPLTPPDDNDYNDVPPPPPPDENDYNDVPPPPPPDENDYNDVPPPPPLTDDATFDDNNLPPPPPPPDENGVIESLLRYYREILDIQETYCDSLKAYYDSLKRKSDLENKIAMLKQVINDAPMTNAKNVEKFLNLLNEKASRSISANDINWNLSDDQFRDFVRSVIR